MEYVKQLKKQVRLADYISLAQIFLRDNLLLDRPLQKSDIKPRLLGHWGTSPGINYVYANINRLINKNKQKDFLFVVGPGHGFPAFQANLFIEKSLTSVYPNKIPFTLDGLKEVITNFSAPYGYPSHLNPEAPGVILEGGELGYSLAVSAGSVLDNKDLITVCLVGDGESETGPLAASWNVNRFINPRTDGVVLPVLHLNGYKISGPTVFGRMSDDEITDFFRAHGYTPLFIDYDKDTDLYEQGIKAFDQAMQMINTLKNQSNTEMGLVAPRWPVIVLKTPKGMGAPKEVNGIKVEGNCASHQIVFQNLHSDSTEGELELKQLEKWLKSYQIHELISFEDDGSIKLDNDIEKNIPEEQRRLGASKYAHGLERNDLDLPDIEKLYTHIKTRGEKGVDEMKKAGEYMRGLFELNKENFRLFSPDETYSNHLTEVFKRTQRAWQWPIMPWDKDMSKDGRVIEILSEHVLFGMLVGYTMTGRYGFFVTYESFAHIVSSMAEQYMKFVSVARNVSFRERTAPLNIILSSLLERQDHNGFSHQNPSFISGLLNSNPDIVNVYFPADKNLMLEAMDISLSSSDSINIIVAGKKMQRTWLTPEEAKKHADNGASVWEFLSNPGEPDVVLATCGDYVNEEAIIGLTMFRKMEPNVKIRFVNFFKLDMLDENLEQHDKGQVYSLLTKDKPIVFNYHGYPATIQKLLFNYELANRIIINGYEEKGSTTTPFDMKARNGLSRYQVVQDLSSQAELAGVITKGRRDEIFSKMQTALTDEKEYIIEHKIDPPEITNW